MKAGEMKEALEELKGAISAKLEGMTRTQAYDFLEQLHSFITDSQEFIRDDTTDDSEQSDERKKSVLDDDEDIL